MKAIAAVFLVALACPYGARAYSTGATKDECLNLTPNHGTNNVMVKSYTIYASGNTFSPSTKVQVTIQGTFVGFILQAREDGTSNVVGTWDTPPADTIYLQCIDSTNNTMTHASNVSKTDVVFNWIPPSSNPPNSIKFIATVVKSYDHWQGNATSHLLQLQMKSSGGGPAPATKPPAGSQGPTTPGGVKPTTPAGGVQPTTVAGGAKPTGGNTTFGGNQGASNYGGYKTTTRNVGGSAGPSVVRAGSGVTLGVALAFGIAAHCG